MLRLKQSVKSLKQLQTKDKHVINFAFRVLPQSYKIYPSILDVAYYEQVPDFIIPFYNFDICLY